MCLASGSSGNCYYVASQEGGLLIDAGIPARSIVRSLSALNIPIEGRIKGILITHEHADHIKGLSTLALRYNLAVYTSEIIQEAIDGLHYYKKMEGIPRPEVIVGEQFSLAGFEIEAFNVPHDSTSNMGYFLRRGDFLMTLATDIGHITPEIKHYATRARYLILESNYDPEMLWTGRYPHYLKERVAGGRGHLSNIQSAEFLCDVFHPELKHVWLCHLSMENNHPALCQKTHEQMLRDRGILFSSSFKLETLKRTTPSPLYTLAE